MRAFLLNNYRATLLAVGGVLLSGWGCMCYLACTQWREWSPQTEIVFDTPAFLLPFLAAGLFGVADYITTPGYRRLSEAAGNLCLGASLLLAVLLTFLVGGDVAAGNWYGQESGKQLVMLGLLSGSAGLVGWLHHHHKGRATVSKLQQGQALHHLVEGEKAPGK